jgi:transcriptional regulator with XRE-family HTH domain
LASPVYRFAAIVHLRGADIKRVQDFGMPKLKGPRERTAFGRRMLAARKARGMTQERVCAQLRCSQGTLAQLESESQSSGRIVDFARLYNVDAEWLANGPGETPVAASDNGDAAPGQLNAGNLDSDALTQLLSDLTAIPPRRLSQLLDQIHQEAEAAREAHVHLSKHPDRVKAAPVAARRAKHSTSSVSIRLGDGNPNQGVLALTIVPDPFTAEPGERERALYQRIEAHEKHPK